MVVQMSITRTKGRRRPTRNAIRRWIPDQPGAWVMATAPALAGLVAGTEYGRLTISACWLMVCWILCYCVQFTTARWLKSRMSRRYRAPMLGYCALLAACGVPFVVTHPGVLAWAPAFAALAATSFVAAWKRRERSLWSNGAAVTASALMPMLTFSYGAGTFAVPWPSGASSSVAGVPGLSGVGVALLAYFVITQFGSVLFVKTMIRNRGDRAYLVASWIWHIAFAVWSLIGPRLGLDGWGLASAQAGPWLVAVAMLLLARAIVLPLLARSRTIRPLVTGAVEGVSSLVSFAGALGVALA